VIVILEKNITEEQIENISKRMNDFGLEVHRMDGKERIVLGAIGIQPNFDVRKMKSIPGVADAIKILDPYKLGSRKFRQEDTIIRVNDTLIGGNNFSLIAGPCSIENDEQIFRLAEVVAESGGKILRGGAFKPRTSPYSFQGLGEEGLKLIRKAADHFKLNVITEVMQTEQVDLVGKYTDIYQIGARNMQNYPLLKELGKIGKPVMLKRHWSATLEEWLMSAEYLLSHGNKDVILCERGIRSLDSSERFVFDLSAIPLLSRMTHLPVIADPSHAALYAGDVPAMARAAAAAGACGVMIEIHDQPEKALSDGPQALTPTVYLKLVEDLKKIAEIVGKKY
jgi:3-deoxy-7-phosphoheptulonate synthase